MNYVISIIAAAAFIAPLGAAAETGAAEPVVVAEDGQGARLTLTGAKQAVAHYLNASGQHQLRAGHAEFDRNGNVAVDIVSLQGLAVGHVVVDAKSGTVADARTGALLSRKS